MKILDQVLLSVHIMAGVVTLFAGPVAIFFNFKNPKRHRQAGKIFFYAMLVVCITAIATWAKQPDRVFFQFLLGIAVFVLVSVVRGVRAIRLMQGDAVRPFDFVYQAVMGLGGLWMLSMALKLLHAEVSVALPVLFAVFGLGAFTDFGSTIRAFLRPEKTHPLDWYRLHVGSMFAAFVASTTAFTVNAAPFLPWYLQWFGPAIVLLPLQIHFGRKVREQKRRALETEAIAQISG